MTAKTETISEYKQDIRDSAFYGYLLAVASEDSDKSAGYAQAADNKTKTMMVEGDVDGITDILTRIPTLDEANKVLARKSIDALSQEALDETLPKVKELASNRVFHLVEEISKNIKACDRARREAKTSKPTPEETQVEADLTGEFSLVNSARNNFLMAIVQRTKEYPMMPPPEPTTNEQKYLNAANGFAIRAYEEGGRQALISIYSEIPTKAACDAITKSLGIEETRYESMDMGQLNKYIIEHIATAERSIENARNKPDTDGLSGGSSAIPDAQQTQRGGKQ